MTTNKGEDIVADVVVNTAGYRAGEIMAMTGRALPLVTMSHQYLVTEDVPELTARAERLPLLRDPDVSYYLRQERSGFILGPYEWRATPMWVDQIPEDFSFKLWNDDLERLETYIEAAMARVPPLASAGVRRVVNGPIPYSPDGNPYIGPEHGLRNFFHANTFSFGITQAGGAGKALAEWVTHGEPEWDLWPLDRRRYTGDADLAYTKAKAVEVYQNEYAPAYPHEERLAGRPLKTSSLYARLKAKGAHFGARGGWERAVVINPEGSITDHTLSFRRERSWRNAVAAEVRAVREHVGVLDLPGFTKFEVSGPGAEAFLDTLTCSRLPQPGRISLAYVLTERGRILSEFTIARTSPDAFYLIAATTAEWHDLDVLRSQLPSDGSVRIVNRSDTIRTLVVAGPRSRELSGHLTASDLSNAAFPWLAAQTIDILGNPTLVLRVNYVGSLDGRYTRRWRNFREFTMHWRQPGRITACRILASMQWIPCGSTNATAAGSRTSRAVTRRMRRLSIDSCLYKNPPLSAGTRSFARRSAAPPSDSCRYARRRRRRRCAHLRAGVASRRECRTCDLR